MVAPRPTAIGARKDWRFASVWFSPSPLARKTRAFAGKRPLPSGSARKDCQFASKRLKSPNCARESRVFANGHRASPDRACESCVFVSVTSMQSDSARKPLAVCEQFCVIECQRLRNAGICERRGATLRVMCASSRAVLLAWSLAAPLARLRMPPGGPRHSRRSVEYLPSGGRPVRYALLVLRCVLPARAR